MRSPILAPALPLNLLLLLATITLSAGSRGDRRVIAGAYAAGAAVNVLLVLLLATSHAATAGALGAAAGIVCALAIAGPRFIVLVRNLQPGIEERGSSPNTD